MSAVECRSGNPVTGRTLPVCYLLMISELRSTGFRWSTW